MPDTRIKSIGDGSRFGGYLVVWGDEQHRDLQGEYFTPDTDLGLDWYDRRPAIFHHGLDPALGPATIGAIDTLRPDKTGLYAEGAYATNDQREKLKYMVTIGAVKAAPGIPIDEWAKGIEDMRQRYIAMVKDMVSRGLLNWSSGSLPHLVDVESSGRIKRWIVVEGSMTPTPAEPRQTDIMTIKSAYMELGLDLAHLALSEQTPASDEQAAEPAKEQPAIEPPVAIKLDAVTNQTQLPEPLESEEVSNPMNIRDVIMAVLGAVINAGAQLSEEQQNAVIAQVEAAYKPPEGVASAETPLTQEQATQATAAVLPMVTKSIQDMLVAQHNTREAVKAEAAKGLQGMTFGVPASRVTPFTGGQQATQTDGANALALRPDHQISLRTKYADMSAEDMSFYFQTMNAKRSKNHLPPVYDSHMLRELADKAGKSYTAGQISFGDEAETLKAIKSINFMKANELDYSTQAGFGDEWVPDLWSSQLWETARLDNVILPLFNVIEMPSNPFEVPVETTDPSVYFVQETTAENQLTMADANNPIPDSKMGTAKVQLTAKKFALRAGFSSELTEDSIIPWIAQLRNQSLRAMADCVDNVLLNGDDDATINTNINKIDGTPTATDKYLAFDGLRLLWLVTTTTNGVDAGGVAVTLDKIRQARFALARAYSANPANLAIITHSEMYAKLLGLSEFITMDKAGPKATAQTGQIGFIDGMPVMVSNEYAMTNAAGKIPVAGGSLGSLTVAYKPGWFVGYRRRINATVDFIPWADAYQITATARVAFKNRDAECSSGVYNGLV